MISETEFINETTTWESLKGVLRTMPAENSYLMPGLKWGSSSQLYTPAFWKLQYLIAQPLTIDISHRLAPTLLEEIVMCILGGYGIPSEIGILAFDHLKKHNLVQRNISFSSIYEVLASPMELSSGKKIRYRFYNQKSKYIYNLLSRTDINEIPQSNDFELRKWLLSVDGIGLKTASWITRNWMKSNNVAIIDIHILRAGRLTGFFYDHSTDYLKLEQQYLSFCEALDVEASNLDAIIWGYMKKNTKLASKFLNS